MNRDRKIRCDPASWTKDEGLPAGAHVVKAFNTIFGHVLAKGGRLDAFIAADDAEAKARVSTFLESLGLRPFDVGGLHMAQTQRRSA